MCHILPINFNSKHKPFHSWLSARFKRILWVDLNETEDWQSFELDHQLLCVSELIIKALRLDWMLKENTKSFLQSNIVTRSYSIDRGRRFFSIQLCNSVELIVHSIQSSSTVSGWIKNVWILFSAWKQCRLQILSHHASWKPDTRWSNWPVVASNSPLKTKLIANNSLYSACVRWPPP